MSRMGTMVKYSMGSSQAGQHQTVFMLLAAIRKAKRKGHTVTIAF